MGRKRIHPLTPEQQELADLKQENYQLKMENAVIKKIKSLSGSTNREKQTAITSLRRTKFFKLADLLTLIGLKRSTYYYLEAHPLNTSSDNKIADVIRQVKSPQF